MKPAPAKPTDTRTAGHAISRQPKALRDAVSRALVDGADWRTVSRLCREHGLPGVTAMNVSNYKKGAHQDWLAREERIEAARRDSEMTAALMTHYTESGGSPAEAGLMAASEILSRALAGLGPDALRELLATDPKALFAVTRELSRVAELLERRRQAPATAAAAKEEAAPVSPEERTRLMKEIFGLPA